eukprot:766603-Hanusia_phi.AAC.1
MVEYCRIGISAALTALDQNLISSSNPEKYCSLFRLLGTGICLPISRSLDGQNEMPTRRMNA